MKYRHVWLILSGIWGAADYIKHGSAEVVMYLMLGMFLITAVTEFIEERKSA